MIRLSAALLSVLLLAGCATQFGIRTEPPAGAHRAQRAHAVKREAAPVAIPLPPTPAAPQAAPVDPGHNLKWFH